MHLTQAVGGIDKPCPPQYIYSEEEVITISQFFVFKRNLVKFNNW